MLPCLQPVRGCKNWLPWIGQKIERVAQRVDTEAADAFDSGIQVQSLVACCVSPSVSAVDFGRPSAVKNSLATTGDIFTPWVSHGIASKTA